jgi:hypothetical protein
MPDHWPPMVTMSAEPVRPKNGQAAMVEMRHGALVGATRPAWSAVPRLPCCIKSRTTMGCWHDAGRSPWMSRQAKRQCGPHSRTIVKESHIGNIMSSASQDPARHCYEIHLSTPHDFSWISESSVRLDDAGSNVTTAPRPPPAYTQESGTSSPIRRCPAMPLVLHGQ